jgi:hypothetical protein
MSARLRAPAPVAQGIERAPPEREVAGSIPAGRIAKLLKTRRDSTRLDESQSRSTTDDARPAMARIDVAARVAK